MAFLQDSRPLRRRFDQHSVARVLPIGPIASIYNRTHNTMKPNNNSNKDENLYLDRFNSLPPISKIPGLNPDSEVIAAAEKKVFRQFKIHETDSSYVKLAKQGGHKNLLEYREFGKENISSNKLLSIAKIEKIKGPEQLEYEKGDTCKEQAGSPSKEDRKSRNRKNRICDNNFNTISTSCAVGAGKSLIEMKKQSKIIKERPDLLPVDNTEILKHLNAPKWPVLPKISSKSRLTSRFMRVTGR